MDDDGKMWFIDAGGERGPMNFQVPIHYGASRSPDKFEPDFETVWPAPGIADMQGGMGRVRMPARHAQSLHRAPAPTSSAAHRVPDGSAAAICSSPSRSAA